MSGPQNAIMGDTTSTDLPETQVPERDLTEERNRAKFSRTKEFGVLKAHLEQRIEHYQSQLPGGPGYDVNLPYAEKGMKTEVANTVISEFRGIIQAYEDAAEVVKNANK